MAQSATNIFGLNMKSTPGEEWSAGAEEACGGAAARHAYCGAYSPMPIPSTVIDAGTHIEPRSTAPPVAYTGVP